MRELPTLTLDLKQPEKFGNVAALLDQNERRTLATDLMELIEIDRQSMSDWLAEAEGYLENVKPDAGNEMPQNREQEGAGERPPPSTEMTLTACIQFSARATDALLGEPDLAYASKPGAEPLAAWVSEQIRTTDPNWLLDTDPLIVHMSVTGLAWRKRAFNTEDRVFHSYFRTCSDVIINANVRNVTRAPRITDQFERYPYEIDRSIRRKHWVDYEPTYDERDRQAPKKFFECDVWLDLDGDLIEEPWTVTISRDDHPEIVRIEPRWSRKTIVEDAETLYFKPSTRFYPYRMLPDPNGGFFPIGFGALLKRTEGAADRLLAAVTDTAESSSSNGGVLAGGGEGLPSAPVELKNNRVNTIPTGGRKLDDMYTPFPVKTVSSGDVQVLEKMITLGDRISGTLNMLENAPASMTATLAKGLIDNGTQVQSAIHRRLCTSLTQEFHMFVQMADAYDMLADDAGQPLSTSQMGGVAVTADPQLATEMHRSALAGVYMELLKDPLTDWKEVRLRLYRTLRLPDPEKLLGQPQTPQATPFEKIKGVVELTKANTDKLKMMGGLAVQFTQAIKNLVDANGGMVDARMAVMQATQLELVLNQMMEEAKNASTQLDGMAGQSGNGSPAQVPPPPQSADSGGLPGGGGAGPGAAGASQSPA